VSRNQHRLARLDSTLAGMSRDQLISLDDDQVRLAARLDGPVAEAVKDGLTHAAKTSGVRGR